MRVENLFAGETALVTGAASNIGRGIAKAIAAQGAEVIATDIDVERGRSLIDEIAADGGKAEFMVSDLSLPSAPATFLTTLGPRALDVSMFVHSASPRRLEQWNVGAVTEAEYDAMANTNTRSGFFIARAIGQHMVAKQTKGRMLFITSLHAGTPRNLPHYAIAKAGQTMAVKELARFFAPSGIRVNAIAPGAIAGGGFKADVSAMSAKIPMGRMGAAEDIANAALALLCDRFCGYVTGTTLTVDGGIALFNWIDPAKAG
jgi:3-oxoacyl-[acyl-carrier protein] reductase